MTPAHCPIQILTAASLLLLSLIASWLGGVSLLPSSLQGVMTSSQIKDYIAQTQVESNTVLQAEVRKTDDSEHFSASERTQVENDIVLQADTRKTEISEQNIFSEQIPVGEKSAGKFYEWGESLRTQFYSADPFPSIELTDLLDKKLLRECVAAIERVPRDKWTHEEHFPHTHNKHRLANSQWAHTPQCKFVADLQANPLLTEFVKGLSGEHELHPKPVDVYDTITGWPLIGIAKGGYLAEHSDYNWNKQLGMNRFLTLMLYLNDDWQDHYGGDLEIFTQTDPYGSPCEARCNPEIKFHHKVLPSFNKAFIWINTPYAYHGHPTPVAAPDDRMRLALQFIWFRKIPMEFPRQKAIFFVKCDTDSSKTCESSSGSSCTKLASPGNCSSKHKTRNFKHNCACAISDFSVR